MDLAEKVRPAHTALLVVDVQKDYFGAGGIIDLMGDDPSALEALLPPLDRFLDVARRTLPVVIFTQQSFYPFLRSPAVVEEPRSSHPVATIRGFWETSPGSPWPLPPKGRYSRFSGRNSPVWLWCL